MTTLSPLRLGRITGSRVSKVLNISPYGDAGSVLREMIRERFGAPSEFTGNAATAYGQRYESAALAAYEQYKGVMVHGGQEFIIHPEHDFLGVTPDGFVGETGLVELKAPYSASYTSIEERPDYFAQIQLQLACTGRDYCDFVVWRPNGTSFSRVNQRTGWLNNAMPSLRDFLDDYHHIESLITDGDSDARAQFLGDRDADTRDDMEWQLAALNYLEAHAVATRAEEALKAARQDLLDLAGGRTERGFGVQISRTERKGAIDYARAAEDLGITSFEPYRKRSSVVVSVRRSA